VTEATEVNPFYRTIKPTGNYDVRETEEDVLTLARARAREAFRQFDTIAVMFSGGKDSTCVLHVALETAEEVGRLPLKVCFYDEEAIPYQTEEYVREVAGWPGVDLEWWCLPVKHRNACSRRSPWWYPWAPEAEPLWVRPLPPEAITPEDAPWCDWSPGARLDTVTATPLRFDPETFGSVGLMMGIRAQESLRRRRVLSRTSAENYVQGGFRNVRNVYPIYDWRTTDVWAAPRKFGWSYNRAYDAMDKAGMAPHSQRCSPAFGEEPLERFWTYQCCFPEIWGKMTARVPGAAAAGRYARTELWGYGGLPPKREGETWMEFVRRMVEKWDEPERSVIAARIKQMIGQHYRKTSDPILSTAMHPFTGVSWTYLARLAFRGDLKGRKTPNMGHGHDDRAWKKYRELLAVEGRRGGQT